MPIELGPFPTDEFTLTAVEHAMDARFSVDDEGNHTVVGADFNMPHLLNFLSGYDKTKVVPMTDSDGYMIPESMMVEYIGGPIYTRDDIIKALISEVRKLRAITNK